MTEPIDITDPALAKAYAHPLRVQILGLLENRVATPAQLATEMGAGLSQTSYHVRQLRAFGLIKLVERRVKRGAVEHYYTATVRPTITDVGWSQVPKIVKRAMVGGAIAQAGKELAESADRGGLDRDDMHFTRTRLTLTREGWKEVSRVLTDALERIDAIAATSAVEPEDDPDVERDEATVVMLLFESPPPDSFAASANTPIVTDELDDIPRR